MNPTALPALYLVDASLYVFRAWHSMPDEFRGADGHPTAFELTDYAYRLWQQDHDAAALPNGFVDARSLPPAAHLAMQAALQPFVDQAISKTINVPADLPFDAFRTLFERAHALGLKGCTAFRPNPVTGAVLRPAEPVSSCRAMDHGC